jgi:hypothetical protein
VGLAFQNHHDTNKHFPTGGWGWFWIGDPDMGFDENQCGGWVFNILPFLEQQALYEIGAGAPGGPTGPAKRAANAERMRKPVQYLNCPSRRAAVVLPQIQTYHNADPTPLAGKCDYVVNAGDQNRHQCPATCIAGDPTPARGPEPNGPMPPKTPIAETGISFRCSKITIADVLDGTSNTLCVGEKFLASYDGNYTVDNENIYCGYVNDLFRSTHASFFPPRRDIPGVILQVYGSAHAAAFNAVFCDGSVKPVNYRVAQQVYARLGNRRDGQVITAGAY